jgi:chromosome segregation ATPase
LFRIESISREIISQKGKSEEIKYKIIKENQNYETINSEFKKNQDLLNSSEKEKEKIFKLFGEVSVEFEKLETLYNSKESSKNKINEQLNGVELEISALSLEIVGNNDSLLKLKSHDPISILESTIKNKTDFLAAMEEEDEGFSNLLKQLKEDENSLIAKESKLNSEFSTINETISEIENLTNADHSLEISILKENLISKENELQSLLSQFSDV